VSAAAAPLPDQSTPWTTSARACPWQRRTIRVHDLDEGAAGCRDASRSRARV